jgi:hypothetical protein
MPELSSRSCGRWNRESKILRRDVKYEEILCIGFVRWKANSLPSSLLFKGPFKELIRDVSDI